MIRYDSSEYLQDEQNKTLLHPETDSFSLTTQTPFKISLAENGFSQVDLYSLLGMKFAGISQIIA